VRVPLIVAGPGVEPGKVRNELVTLADIVPTMCDAAGVGAPADMRGTSLLKPSSRPFVVSELRYETADREGRMLRGSRYKYVVFNSGARPEQLFDLELDPGENQNLVTSGSPLLSEHRSMMRRWLSETGDRFRLPG
jgi:arylsulfatase A-like enzyme